jgi:hypothetical protein
VLDYHNNLLVGEARGFCFFDDGLDYRSLKEVLYCNEMIRKGVQTTTPSVNLIVFRRNLLFLKRRAAGDRRCVGARGGGGAGGGARTQKIRRTLTKVNRNRQGVLK